MTKIQTLKDKMKKNKEKIVIYGGATAIAATYCTILAKIYKDQSVKMREEQLATLNDAISKGYHIMTNSDASRWYIFDPEKTTPIHF